MTEAATDTLAARFRRAIVTTPMMPVVRVRLRAVADNVDALHLDRLLPSMLAVARATPQTEREQRVDDVIRRAAAALGVRLLPVELNTLRAILLSLVGGSPQ